MKQSLRITWLLHKGLSISLNLTTQYEMKSSAIPITPWLHRGGEGEGGYTSTFALGTAGTYFWTPNFK